MATPYKFVFTTEQAESAGVSDPKKLPKLIEKARNLAQSPITGINVGAVGLALSGRVYLGVNVEFPGLPLNLSIHAEQFLVTNLDLNSELGLTHLALSDNGTVFGEPCTRCSQFLQEISNADEIEIMVKNTNDGEGSFRSLERLMPDKFGPNSILPAEASLLLEQRDNRLFLLNHSVGTSCRLTHFAIRILMWARLISSNPDRFSHLKSKALAAANKSYAPHSKCPSGVALICEGEVYSGWYIESVSSNPSVGPVQAALVDFMSRSGGKGFDKITGAVLVEKKNAKVRQEDKARMLLKEIAARNCDFKVFHCYEMTGEAREFMH